MNVRRQSASVTSPHASIVAPQQLSFGVPAWLRTIVDRGLAIASKAGGALQLELIRRQLDRVLGPSARNEVGWLEKEGAPTRDVTARFKDLYAAARANKPVLPAEARDHVYLTIRGYTGDNVPGYMQENREGLSRRGLDVREIEVDTEKTVRANAKVVRDSILRAVKETGKKVVLVGHSKGGLDLTAAVALYPELKQHVRAAVTMQSPYGGVPVATDVMDHPLLHGIAGNTVDWVLRGDRQSLADFSYAQRQAFVRAHPWPTDIPTVSLATSSSSQLNGLTPMINWYRLRYGEKTDGVVSTRDSIVPGSNVVRLDNLDHLNSVMSGFPGRANYDPRALTEALVALALTTPPVVNAARAKRLEWVA